MACTLNREARERLFDDDLEWLLQQPRSLERDHIADVLRWMKAAPIEQLEGATGVVQVQTLLRSLTDDERRDVVGLFCTACGRLLSNARCYCMRDD